MNAPLFEQPYCQLRHTVADRWAQESVKLDSRRLVKVASIRRLIEENR